MTIYSFLHERGIDEVYQATVVAVFWLVLGGFVIRKRVTAAGGGVLPDEGVSVRNILEVIVGIMTDAVGILEPLDIGAQGGAHQASLEIARERQSAQRRVASPAIEGQPTRDSQLVVGCEAPAVAKEHVGK